MLIRSLNVDNLSREETRKKVLEAWIKEDAGAGQYRYDVEICRDGSRIYLLRPGRLNKGCDFVIVSENYLKFKNGNDKPPQHKDVFELLNSFCSGNRLIADAMKQVIRKVYNCAKPDEALAEFPALQNLSNCVAERSIKLIKWMWIEQDVTYWTGQGRAMLCKHLVELLDK